MHVQHGVVQRRFALGLHIQVCAALDELCHEALVVMDARLDQERKFVLADAGRVYVPTTIDPADHFAHARQLGDRRWNVASIPRDVVVAVEVCYGLREANVVLARVGW